MLFSLWTLCPAHYFGSRPVHSAAQRSSPNTHRVNGCGGTKGNPLRLEPPPTETAASTASGELLCQQFPNLSKHGSHAELFYFLLPRILKDTSAPPSQFPGTTGTLHHRMIMPSWACFPQILGAFSKGDTEPWGSHMYLQKSVSTGGRKERGFGYSIGLLISVLPEQTNPPREDPHGT